MRPRRAHADRVRVGARRQAAEAARRRRLQGGQGLAHRVHGAAGALCAHAAAGPSGQFGHQDRVHAAGVSIVMGYNT